ncbi:MAG: chromosome partitioning protein ParA, partial [Prevotellaceae bacterium]|nr:chromosome partitioning protein ParA [Prevotellaceae bacterium]
MVQTKNTANTRRIQTDDSLSIVDMLMLCLRHWLWFILSLIVCMGVATLYLLSTPKTYTRTMSILVKSGSSGKSEEIKTLEELGVGNLTTEISDEIVAIHSPAAIYDMVKRLHLDISYFSPGFFRDEPLYAETLPVEVEMPDIDDNVSFTLKLNGDETVTLSDITLRGEPVVGTFRVKIGKKFKSPFGSMTLKPTIYYQKGMKANILVQRTSYQAAAQRYGALISASLRPGTENIIDVRCLDNSIPRAENVLKTMINIYNENWVENRNKISVSTNEFIKERLAVIEEELGDVDQNIAGYKSAQAMPDVSAVAAQAMGEQSAADQQRQAINNQLYMVRYVRNYVTDPAHAKQLLPAGSGIGNAAVESQIAAYNEKLLERNNLVANSSEKNPLVGDLDVALGNLKGAIINSLDNAQMTLNSQLGAVQSVRSQAIGKLSANPQQANHLLSFERQQKVKESLYLFLLQKREENELSQAFTAYNTRIIANPWGSNAPTSPERNKILMYAIIIALALPSAFFILREIMNSKVRGRKDLENLTIPYVGELPLWKPKKGEEAVDGNHFVVRQHSRDITNEAYRVVRTNLEFMTNQEKKCKVIMLTSFNPGSGKTFITANLGASFAIRGSRVICIDLDLRRGS